MDTALAVPVELTDKEFEMFRELVFKKSGISLHDGKKELVRTRLGARVRNGGFKSYKEYYAYIKDDPSEMEIVNLLDAISTNLTSFFREPTHFTFLTDKIIPEIVESKRAMGENDVRAWSAGCSSGEEPYSLAFTLMDHMETIQTWNVKLLATDLSTQMLDRARKGVYRENSMKAMSKSMLRKYFQKGVKENAGTYRVRPEARQMISFKRFNFMSPTFPFHKKFSFIFCRNVMIYFDKPTQQQLISKFYNALEPKGYLLIGHSESLTGVKHQFKYIQPTIYQKP